MLHRLTGPVQPERAQMLLSDGSGSGVGDMTQMVAVTNQADDPAATLAPAAIATTHHPVRRQSSATTASRRAAIGLQAPTCQVLTCHADLSALKDYHLRYKICDIHLKAPSIVLDGQESRFCQQCGRFHLLSAFDATKRSCRERLSRHNARRRRRETAHASSAEQGDEVGDVSDGGGNDGELPATDTVQADLLASEQSPLKRTLRKTQRCVRRQRITAVGLDGAAVPGRAVTRVHSTAGPVQTQPLPLQPPMHMSNPAGQSMADETCNSNGASEHLSSGGQSAMIIGTRSPGVQPAPRPALDTLGMTSSERTPCDNHNGCTGSMPSFGLSQTAKAEEVRVLDWMNTHSSPPGSSVAMNLATCGRSTRPGVAEHAAGGVAHRSGVLWQQLHPPLRRGPDATMMPCALSDVVDVHRSQVQQRQVQGSTQAHLQALQGVHPQHSVQHVSAQEATPKVVPMEQRIRQQQRDLLDAAMMRAMQVDGRSRKGVMTYLEELAALQAQQWDSSEPSCHHTAQCPHPAQTAVNATDRNLLLQVDATLLPGPSTSVPTALQLNGHCAAGMPAHQPPPVHSIPDQLEALGECMGLPPKQHSTWQAGHSLLPSRWPAGPAAMSTALSFNTFPGADMYINHDAMDLFFGKDDGSSTGRCPGSGSSSSSSSGNGGSSALGSLRQMPLCQSRPLPVAASGDPSYSAHPGAAGPRLDCDLVTALVARHCKAQEDKQMYMHNARQVEQQTQQCQVMQQLRLECNPQQQRQELQLYMRDQRGSVVLDDQIFYTVPPALLADSGHMQPLEQQRHHFGESRPWHGAAAKPAASSTILMRGCLPAVNGIMHGSLYSPVLPAGPASCVQHQVDSMEVDNNLQRLLSTW